MRTFLVLICSLALACTADAKEEKKKEKSASKENHARSVQHESARRGVSGTGQHLQQPKAPQRVAKPHVAPAEVRPVVRPQQQGGPETAAHTVQPQPRGGPETPAHTTTSPQSPAAPLTKEQLDEAYAQSQGFRSAQQYRKWKETGRVEIPAGVVISQTPKAGVGPGSVQKAEHGITASAISPATNQAKANPFRLQHFNNLPIKPDPAITSVKFQGTGHIEGSENWTDEKYAAFRNYHHEWHDKDWWEHHPMPVDLSHRPTPIPLPKPSHSPTPIHSPKPSPIPKPSPTPPNPVILVSGGRYFRNACYWYPA